MRSSLGRLSRRPDVAALALVFVVAAFTSGAAMVTSIGPGLAVPVAALVFVPWAGMLAWAARGRARLRSSGQVLCRLALALVPLGLSMWSAHVLFHLLTGWSSVWPVAQRVAADAGVHALGEASWGMVSPLVSADGLLRLQILLLDLGLLVSLYVGWRIVRGAGSRSPPGQRPARSVGDGRRVPLRGRRVDLPAANGHARDGPLSRRLRPALAAALMLLLPQEARPDGGVVRLRETRGEIVVTVFTPPDPLRAGVVDVSVLVQDLAGAPVLDAEVTIRFDPPPGGASSGVTVRASHARATNKLFQAAQVELGEVGLWRLGVSVRRAGQASDLSSPLPIAPATHRVKALWDVLALPPLMVGLFALNQTLRRRRAPDRPGADLAWACSCLLDGQLDSADDREKEPCGPAAHQDTRERLDAADQAPLFRQHEVSVAGRRVRH